MAAVKSALATDEAVREELRVKAAEGIEDQG
jgi:hypothetical protein